MPTFETPDPISATVDVVHGDVRITAGDRGVTVVNVEPSHPGSDEDRKAAAQTRIEYAGGRLLVKTQRLRSWLPRSTGGSVDMTIELPAGSQLRGSGGLADFRCEGRLGECRLRLGLGRIDVESAEAPTLKSGSGDIVVDRATGHADIAAGSGDVRVRELAGTGVIKNSNGDIWVGAAHGDLRVSAANGDVAIDVADATVTSKSANGSVRVGEAVRGAIVLETAHGDLEVGIREGTSAYLDVRTVAGRVRNALEAADAPDPSGETVEVRAHTTVGDVVIHHA